MRPRICAFSLAYHPFVGGAEVAIKEIASRIPESDFSVITHSFKSFWPAREKSGNIEIIRLPAGPFGKISYIWKAWRRAEREHARAPFKVVWGMMAAYAGAATLLFKLNHPEVPFVLTLQEGDSERHILKKVSIFYPFWRMIFKKADRIQAISNYLAEFARRHGATCPVEVIPNGVDLEKFTLKSTESGKNIIITTSRLVKKNGVDTLIEAAGELKERGVNFFVRILGGGPDEKELKTLAARLGVVDRVEFFGSVAQSELPRHLADADVFVRASRSEGLGNSFLEAMAIGLPVIGTPVGGIPDFLKDGETGLFCRPEDAKDLADKIEQLIKDRKLAFAIAERGCRLARKNYSWEGIAGKMAVIFSGFSVKSELPKILIATGIYPPDIGGPATYTVLLEKELPKRGFEVLVLPFTQYRSMPKWQRHFRYYRDLKKMARNNNVDIIYAQDPVSVGLPSALVARKLGKKFFIRVAGDYAWEQAAQRFGVKDGIDEFQNKKYGWQTEFLRRIQRWVVGRADVVITPSKYFQKLIGGWISNPEKVRVIYNGVRLDAVPAGKHNKTIITAGRLVPWKGFDVLIECMKDLPEWQLRIVGEGPDEKRLHGIIAKLGMTERVHLHGMVRRDELLKMLGEAGAFVLNTSFESFSFQTVEAMHAGTPVIVTDVGSLPELVENGREGVLVKPNDTKAIIAAMKKIKDPVFREMIVKNSKEKAKMFSIEKTMDNLVNLINESAGR